MNWQKYLDIIAERLRELGVADNEMARPLRTFEQFLNDNDDEDLRASLENPDEMDDFVQNLYMMIIKRRQRNAARQTQQAEQNVPSMQPQQMPYQMQQPVQPQPVQSQPQPMQQRAPQMTLQQDDKYDMNQTMEMGRVMLRSAPSEPDDSMTRTMNAVSAPVENEPAADEPQSAYVQAQPDDSSAPLPPVDLPEPEPPMPPQAVRMPVDAQPEMEDAPEKPRKMTRKEAKHEQMHMYEDLPGISRSVPEYDNDYGRIDPTAFDDEIKYKGSPAFWLIFILTLPITVPILAALGMIFIGAFAALAVLIVGFIALLVADVIAGTALSLVGIIYGITQTFTVVPIGLYEIGIGIIIGGAALFIGILLYNTAVRLLPFLCRLLYDFFRFCCAQLRRLFNYLKKESVKA